MAVAGALRRRGRDMPRVQRLEILASCTGSADWLLQRQLKWAHSAAIISVGIEDALETKPAELR